MNKTHRIPAQSVLALSLLAALLLSSGAAAEGCRASLRVCARLIIPSLFPFFVLSETLDIQGFAAPASGLFRFLPLQFWCKNTQFCKYFCGICANIFAICRIS